MQLRDLTEGDVFAGYRIERVLGEGGMGVVYLAEQLDLGRKVALKLLPPSLAADDRFRERFVRESKLAASLDDPNVIPIYEAGEHEGRLYLAMRYVEGTDLQSLLESGGALDPSGAISIVSQVASALDAAHDKGLVHRDVKPANILLAAKSGGRATEHVYLTDFGLTKRAASGSGLTAAGQFLGSIDYAAPEQIQGGAVTPQTDVYALGGVLYQCLTGKPPFVRDTDVAVVYAHLQDAAPKPSDAEPDLPPAIDNVVAKAMAKEPKARFSTAGDLATAAGEALGLGTQVTEAVATGRRRRARRRRSRLLAAGIAAAVVVALVAILLPRVLGGGPAAPVFQPGTVALDVETGKQVGFISRSALQDPAIGVFAGRRFWLNDARSNTFVAVDPARTRISAQFPAPPNPDENATYQPYAVQDGAIWIGSGHDLVKIDVGVGKEVDRTHLDKVVGDKGVTEGVALGGGLVWVSRDVGRGQIIGFDAATGEVRYRFDDVEHHDDIAYDGGVVFGVNFGGVDVADPATGLVKEVKEISHTSRLVVGGGGYGWTTDPPKGVLYKISPAGDVVGTYRTGQGASGISFTDGKLWVGNPDEGTVAGVDLITGKQTTYRFGHPADVLAAGAGVVLVRVAPGRTVEDRIDALTGNVLRLFSQQGALGEGDEPALNWNPAAFQVDFATCAKLLNYPDVQGPGGLQLRPEVAAGMPSLSADRRTYTFTVRPGYRFSPPVNQPVTAETFRYSIERALSPKLGDFEPAAYYVSDIDGEQAFRDGKAQHISGLRASGDQLSITLTELAPDFLERLALPFFCPVPVGTPFLRGAPVRGTTPTRGGYIPSAGPYYVAEYLNDVSVILKRNPNYHGPRPHALDAIALREAVDAGVGVDRVLHQGWGGIVSSGHHGTSLEDPLLAPGGALATRYEGAAAGQARYVPVPLPGTGFVALNASRGPFADPVVRRAASLAIDRVAVAAVWDLVPTDQLLPPAFPGFQDRELSALRADPTAARHLLKGRHLDVTMAVFKDCDPCAEEAQLVRAELGQIGIRVKLKEYDDPFGAAADPSAKIDLTDSGVNVDYPDSASFLSRAFESTPGGWVRPDVRRAVMKVAGLSGSERQSAAADLADRLVANEIPVIVYGNDAVGEFFGPKAGCQVFPPFGYGVDLAALCLKS